MKKLKQEQGETILEVLLALLIAVLCIFFMTEALTTASEINQKSQDSTIGFSYKNASDYKMSGTAAGVFSIEYNVKSTTKKETLKGSIYTYNSSLGDTVNRNEVNTGSTHYYYAVTQGKNPQGGG